MKRVPLWRSLGFIQIDERATYGATIGTNVYNADGSLFEPEAAAADGDSDTPAVTLWSLVQEIPANVTALAAMTGDGYVKKAGSSFSAAPLMVPIGCTFDGGGSVLEVGATCDVYVPYACTITKATLLADQVGSLVVSVWKDSYGNFPPTALDNIAASTPPTLSAAIKSQDSTLTGWTTAIAAGSTLRFTVASVTAITRAILTLEVTRA